MNVTAASCSEAAGAIRFGIQGNQATEMKSGRPVSRPPLFGILKFFYKLGSPGVRMGGPSNFSISNKSISTIKQSPRPNVQLNMQILLAQHSLSPTERVWEGHARTVDI